MLCDASGDAVQLDAVDTGIRQALRFHTEEVADAAAWLQQIAALEAHVLQRLIHGADDHRRCVERSQ